MVAIFLLTAVFILMGAAGLVYETEATTITKGVHIVSIDVSGMTPKEAKERICEATEGLRLTFADEHTALTIAPAGAYEDDGSPVATFDIDRAVRDAFNIGQSPNPVIALLERAYARLFARSVPLPYELDEELLEAKLRNRFGKLLEPAENARLEIMISEDNPLSVEVIPEKEGLTLNTDALLAETKEGLATLTGSRTTVTVTRDLPTLRHEEIEPLRDGVRPILDRLPIAVKAGGDSWEISAEQAAGWITAERSPEDGVVLAADRRAIEEYFKPRAELLRAETRDAVFVEEDGRVTEFVPAVSGEKLDVRVSTDQIAEAVMRGYDRDAGPLVLPIITAYPNVTTEQSNPYGIREIIGTGESNFRGSPYNRKVNIGIGAKTLNGILIPPDEKFSLLGALGEIDASQGYLQELVIKERETKPEYGGGLCQIGTTTFRVTLNSGLPIVERRNHSYRVPYYERDGDGNYMGPGKDATIYDPAPDFKFINDTGTTMLIQTRIEGNKLIFDFWGKKDGREVEQGDVSVFNIVPPPDKKVIKTTGIEPGTEKCTESPHSGATSVFTYTVTYPDGEVKEEDFYSYYKPWGEVCLIGVTQEELDAVMVSGEVDADGVVIPPAEDEEGEAEGAE